MIREITLINSDGSRFELNNDTYFAHEPVGFGYSTENEVVQFSRYQRLVNQKSTFETIGFNVLIVDNDRKTAYQNWNEFGGFLRVGGLKIEYRNDNDVYLRDVVLQQFPFTERGDYYELDIELTFTPLTPFYKYAVFTNRPDDGKLGAKGKTYYVSDNGKNKGFYTYAYTYSNSYYNLDDHTLKYDAKVSGVLFEQDNKAINMKVRLNNLSQKILMELHVDQLLNQSDAYVLPQMYWNTDGEYSMEINTSEHQREATLVRNSDGLRISAVQYQDFTRTGFVRLLSGKRNLLTLTGAVFNDVEVTLEYDYV